MLTKTARKFKKPYKPYSGLTPSQSDRAKDFLGSMLLGALMAQHAGVQMNMTKWIQAYRGHVGRKTNGL